MRYRLHFTHPDGVTTTDDHESAEEVAVGDVIDVGGRSWRVEEVEPFGLEDYEGLVGVVPFDEVTPA